MAKITKSSSKKQGSPTNSPAVPRALAAKPKPRASGTFKPGGELAATIK
ncbi:MAG: hypothetical protein FD155_3482 [Bacteroidetes bacterium]|nr:MAG: hypothetical protein FD155_3482 [Bacteroidota bacterium]